ncbi:xanthine dehydrogenase small subunit [Chitinophaga sp. CF118]|uniref:2Fe-2S iron-sulfur cluster-binding protein n=1 Tax=Chitinophaga sp. CF118 TaxID=1884367 RepID=UPI0008F0EA2C|nr:2Fe-2S iron-sulfur cluster-binding protein [Chitinophaga sp. CF118]SFD60676.1 xanthine dehydrogenase small subunit [Chitinophaga sp. CF118]
MLNLILNNESIGTGLPKGMLLLDFIRYHQHLTGTKTGCNEGDCGACTVLVGEIRNNELQYRSFTSCLTPLGNVQGKHVVTIEGVNMEVLNPVQQAMVDHSATQCGFCTPGFVMSLAGFCLSRKAPVVRNAIAAVDGNICRCTGYKSIERAAVAVTKLLQDRNGTEPLQFAVEQGILPAYFTGIKERLNLLVALNGEHAFENAGEIPVEVRFAAGGTDLYVQQPEEMQLSAIHFLLDQKKDITKQGNRCVLEPAVTVTDLLESAVMRAYFPQMANYVKRVSSTPIRNMATIAGNFINASPIGDFTIFFLALNAMLEFNTGRTLLLSDLYLGYKKLDKSPDEYIRNISFELPGSATLFNFEKVCKRTHLDIASVNTAISITTQEDTITSVLISAGGVAPVPLLLKAVAEYLTGKTVSEKVVLEAIEIAQTEISPMSDTRGSAEYKRLLLGQLIKAHFITLFPWLHLV